MKVLVMTAVAPNERDLQIVIVARLQEGVTLARVSPIITLEEAAAHRNGNPYYVYGDVVAEFTGRNKLYISISVFDCTSGDFQGWL